MLSCLQCPIVDKEQLISGKGNTQASDSYWRNGKVWLSLFPSPFSAAMMHFFLVLILFTELISDSGISHSVSLNKTHGTKRSANKGSILSLNVRSRKKEEMSEEVCGKVPKQVKSMNKMYESLLLSHALSNKFSLVLVFFFSLRNDLSLPSFFNWNVRFQLNSKNESNAN